MTVLDTERSCLRSIKLIANAMTVIEAKVKLLEASYNEPGYSK